VLLAVPSIAIAVIAACSSTVHDEDGPSTTPSGSGGAAGGMGDGGTGDIGTGGTRSASTTGAGASGSGGACASLEIKTEKVPLDIFIMLDQSGSMEDDNKWGSVTGAIGAFVSLPEVSGIGVGLQYFALPASISCPPSCTVDADCGTCGPCFQNICIPAGSSDSCNPADYATAEVPIAPLPGNAQALIDSMAMHGPSTGTPTKPALQGAIDFAKAWAADAMNQNPPHEVVVLLATDGIPEACDTAGIDQVAAAGLAEGIMTFVIGVGTSLTMLDAIAAAGGTGQAYLVDPMSSPQAEILAAMQDIQVQALPCAFLIPPPPMGETLDFDQVEVAYTPGGGNPVGIPKVDSAAACPANGDGWYYDDPSAPAQIVLCASTCQTVGIDPEAELSIELGCT